MNIYELRSPLAPETLVFGAGASARLVELLPPGTRKVMLVCGNHAVSGGTAAGFTKMLAGAGIESCVFSGIPAEPPLETVDSIMTELRTGSFDAVAAIGGGSVIDAAKTAAFLAPCEGSCRDYFSGLKNVPSKAGLFFAALPTTSGTGSECTRNAVLTDLSTMIKKSIRSTFMLPSLAIVDPELTVSCPPRLTASSGLDAFVQAAEAYVNPKGNTITRVLAITALKKIYSNIGKAYSVPSDINARSEMAEGSMTGGLAFAACGLGAVHGIAHPAGSLLGIPHGIACAVLMPHVSRFNAEAFPEPYMEMAHELGCGDFSLECERLNRSLGIPSTFSEYGLSEKHFDFIIKNCRSGSMKSNPRFMADHDVRAILEKCV